MPIVRPTSGQLILKSDITSMHESVRAQVNAVPVESLGRAGLNADQLPSLVLARDSKNVTGRTRVSQPFTNEGSVDILANWHEIGNFTLNNGSAGYAVEGPAWLVAYVTLRWEKFYDNAGTGAIVKPEERQQQWAALTLEIDGSEQVDPVDSGLVHGQRELPNKVYAECEEIVTIWTDALIPAGAHVIDALRLRVAIGDGGPAATVQFADVVGGHIGFFCVPTE